MNFMLPYKHRVGGMVCSSTPDHSQQVFSHRSDSDGIVRHWDVSLLHEFCRCTGRGHSTPHKTKIRIKQEQARFLLQYSGVEQPHLIRLSADRLREPGILVMLPDDTGIIVDGNHRYVRRWQLGFRSMLFFVFTLEQAALAELAIPEDLAPGLVTPGAVV